MTVRNHPRSPSGTAAQGGAAGPVAGVGQIAATPSQELPFAQATARMRLDSLLLGLADAYAQEASAGGDLAAQVLRESVDRPSRALRAQSDPTPTLGAALAAADAHPLGARVAAAQDLLPWAHPGLEDGLIRPEISVRMHSAKLVGPEALIEDDRVLVGLFLQEPGLDYPQRRHEAEETFFVISGVAEWALADAPPRPIAPGGFARHPSNTLHASVTRDAPLLAAWRWTGNLSYTTYKLIG